MASTILDSLMGMLGPNVVGPVASQLGESTDTVQRGLQTGSAAMLAGLAAKAGQPGFMSSIFNLVSNPANTSGALSSLMSNPGSLLSGITSSPLGSLGGQFMSSIFGSNQSSILDSLGRSTGIGGNKMGTLLTMAAPMVLGLLGQHVRQSGLGAAELGNTLKAEAPSFQRFLPAGLGSLLGGATTTQTQGVVAGPAKVPVTTNRWLWPLVILARWCLVRCGSSIERRNQSAMRCRLRRMLERPPCRRLGTSSRRSCRMASN